MLNQMKIYTVASYFSLIGTFSNVLNSDLYVRIKVKAVLCPGWTAMHSISMNNCHFIELYRGNNRNKYAIVKKISVSVPIH